MATLYRKEGSPYFWMRFQHQGKRYQESTGQNKESKAQTAMEKRIDEIKGSGSYHDLFERLLLEIKRQPLVRQDPIRHELAKQLLSETREKLPIKDAFPLYKAKPKKRNPTERTVKDYGGSWTNFTDWQGLNHPKIEYIHEISPAIAEEYMTWLWAANVTEGTYNRKLVFLRSMFDLIQSNAGLTENVWKTIDKLQSHSISKEMLSPKQLEDICAEAEGELKTLFLIGLYTGLRLGDAVSLRWDEIKNLDLENGFIEKIPSKTKKLRKAVTIPLHTLLHATLLSIRDNSLGDSPFVLPEMADLYQRNGSNVSKRIQEVFTQAGIETTTKRDDKRGKRATVLFGFHSLRHSFVSLCAANKVPQIAVMELVGHNSAAVHAIYQHASDEMKVQAIASLPTIGSTE
jgi:integrase